MMCLIGIFPAKGVSQTLDSLSTIEMKEVVVKARMHRTDASSSIFTPTARQKTSAQNAIDLLKQLAIPQININLMDNTVTTPSGQGVDIYINYIPASAEEMEGISTSMCDGWNTLTSRLTHVSRERSMWSISLYSNTNMEAILRQP